MAREYICGVAFILEGETEKVFYQELLEHFCNRYPGTCIIKNESIEEGEVTYSICYGDKRILLKFNNVGTISQITNTGDWFLSRCLQQHKNIKWTVFLCYDMDDYAPDISKFYAGDWKRLRDRISKGGRAKIIDMAAKADIEDMLLLDLDGVFHYIGINPCPLPNGKKGKSKMKQLFRMKGLGSAYHEGERARPLIRSLDMEKIIAVSSISLCEVERACIAPLVESNCDK